MRTVRIAALAGAVLLAISVAAGTSAASAPKRDPRTIEVQVLAINDFHGNLAPPSGSAGLINGTPAGGAEYLATHLRNLRSQAAAKKQYTTTSPPVT